MSLKDYLGVEKKRYLEECKAFGGTAEGFRDRVRSRYAAGPDEFNKFVLDSLMEATTKRWQAPPRDTGTDLFSIGGLVIPEHLTRPAASFVTGEDVENDDRFEKVDAAFATVNDLVDDATIKLRKAAQSSAAAERKMKAADEARRRARGNMSTLLSDIADKVTPPKETAGDSLFAR
jgi:hypothetical protein